MKENNLKLAQQDIEDALATIEIIEKDLEVEDLSKSTIKEQFLILTKKVEQLEGILKEEGIIE